DRGQRVPARARGDGLRVLAAAFAVRQEDKVRVDAQDVLGRQLWVVADAGPVGDVRQSEAAEDLPDERRGRGAVIRLVDLVVVTERARGLRHARDDLVDIVAHLPGQALAFGLMAGRRA